MSQAEALLNRLANDNGVTYANVEVDDTYIIIDNNLRTMTLPKTLTNLGVENDDDVLRLNFKMPRYLNGTDLSTFSIRINYLNQAGVGDVYTVKNTNIGAEYITFSWLVGPTATAHKGNTKFSVCMREVDADNYVIREFNTAITSLPVLEGLVTDEYAVRQYSDLLEQWKRELFGIGDTEEASMHAVSEQEQENIVQKGLEVLATIPEDYTTLSNLANSAERSKADAIVNTEQGEIIELTDSSDDYIRGLKIFGKTTQVKTTGAQLFDTSKLPSFSTGGANVSNNGDGSFTILGFGELTELCGTSKNYTHEETVTLLKKAGTLYFSVNESTVPYLYVALWRNGNAIAEVTNRYNKLTSTRITEEMLNDSTFTMRIGFYGFAGDKIVATTIRPMLYMDGDGTWEPFSDGVSSPSPEYSQELISVGSDDGNTGINIYSRNLFDQNGEYTSTYSNHVLKATADHGVISVSGTSMLGYGTLQVSLPLGVFKKGETYRISRVGNNFHIGFWFYDDNNVNIGSLTTENNMPITIPNNADHMSLFYAGLTPETEVTLTEKFMVNLGTEALPWEPSADTQSTEIPYTLPGIPVSQNGSYTDPNGHQWICDEIDFERKVYVQRIGRLTIDNSIQYYYNTDNYFLHSHAGIIDNVGEWETRILSTHFLPIGNGVDMYDYGWFQFNGNGGIRFRIKGIDSVEALDQWLDNNDPEVIYPLKTPVEIPLTETEIQAFKELRTNFHNTVIRNNYNARMEVKYNVDTKTYLDNKVWECVDRWLTAKYGSIEGGSV